MLERRSLLRKVHPRSNRDNRSVLSFRSAQPGSAATAPPPPARGSTPPEHALQTSFPCRLPTRCHGCPAPASFAPAEPLHCERASERETGKGRTTPASKRRTVAAAEATAAAPIHVPRWRKEKKMPFSLALPLTVPASFCAARAQGSSSFSLFPFRTSCCAADAGALLLPSPGAKCEKSCRGDGV